MQKKLPMKDLLKTSAIFSFALFITLSSCKNKAPKQEENADTLQVADSAPTAGLPQTVEHYFPAKPEANTKDTTFKAQGKKMKVTVSQKTIDSGRLVIEHKVGGRVMRDIFYNYEYTIQCSGSDFNTNKITLTKDVFKGEFNDEFFIYSILYKGIFENYNETTGEFEFKFFINKPDTDNTYYINYFVNKKGETRFEVEDV